MKEMKCLVIGGSGGIGKKLAQLTQYDIIDYFYLSSENIDVSSFASVNATIQNYRPDFVINMAAINIDGLIKNSVDGQEAERQVTVNLLGAYHVMNSAIAYWVESGIKGKIITMSSFLSKRPVKGAGIYSSTKAAIDSLTKTAAIENARYGITVNSICAGFFDAGLTDKLPPKIKESLTARIPVGRLGKVEELQHAINFIFENDYVTGTNLLIDGGVSLV